MENFEGGYNPEIKGKVPSTKRPGFIARAKLAVAILLGFALGPDQGTPSGPEIPSEIRSGTGEPPKPGIPALPK